MTEYYRTQNNVVAFNNVTLTSSFAGNRHVIASGGMCKLSINISYTRGGGEVNSDLQLQLESSGDGVNWFPLAIDSTSTVSVITPRVWELQAPGNINILVDIAYRNMRLSVREASVTTNFGTATVDYTLSGL